MADFTIYIGANTLAALCLATERKQSPRDYLKYIEIKDTGNKVRLVGSCGRVVLAVDDLTVEFDSEKHCVVPHLLLQWDEQILSKLKLKKNAGEDVALKFFDDRTGFNVFVEFPDGKEYQSRAIFAVQSRYPDIARMFTPNRLQVKAPNVLVDVPGLSYCHDSFGKMLKMVNLLSHSKDPVFRLEAWKPPVTFVHIQRRSDVKLLLAGANGFDEEKR